jgi:vesicle coat complex subunit
LHNAILTCFPNLHPIPQNPKLTNEILSSLQGLDILVVIDEHNGALEQTKNKCTSESFQNLQLELSTLMRMKRSNQKHDNQLVVGYFGKVSRVYKNPKKQTYSKTGTQNSKNTQSGELPRRA